MGGFFVQQSIFAFIMNATDDILSEAFMKKTRIYLFALIICCALVGSPAVSCASSNDDQIASLQAQLQVLMGILNQLLASQQNGVQYVDRQDFQGLGSIVVTTPASQETYSAGENLNISFNNPKKGELYSFSLESNAGNIYSLGTTIGQSTNSQKVSAVIPVGVPSGIYSLHVKQVTANGKCEGGSCADGFVRSVVVTNVANSQPGVPFLRVVSPVGGESFFFGLADTDMRIQWTSQKITGDIDLYLVTTEGQRCKIGTSPVTKGSFAVSIGANYRCPNTTGNLADGKYKVLLTSGSSYDGVKGWSEDYITVTNSKHASLPIQLTSPRGGEVFSNDRSKDGIAHITWETAEPSTTRVNIYSINTADGVLKLIASAPNTGSYTWPYDSSLVSGSYKIKVAFDTTSDMSGAFTVYTPEKESVGLKLSSQTITSGSPLMINFSSAPQKVSSKLFITCPVGVTLQSTAFVCNSQNKITSDSIITTFLNSTTKSQTVTLSFAVELLTGMSSVATQAVTITPLAR